MSLGERGKKTVRPHTESTALPQWPLPSSFSPKRQCHLFPAFSSLLHIPTPISSIPYRYGSFYKCLAPGEFVGAALKREREGESEARNVKGTSPGRKQEGPREDIKTTAAAAVVWVLTKRLVYRGARDWPVPHHSQLLLTASSGDLKG